MFKRLLFAFLITLLPTFAIADEVVRYQLAEWKAKHIHDAKKADTIMQTLKKLGCELKKNQHNGHIDVKYRCMKGHELKLNSQEDAHKWEKRHKEINFRTEHKH